MTSALASTRQPSAPKQLLVVDDLSINQEIMLAMLRLLGHEPVKADNAQDALALLTTRRFDLVLMDWHMPDTDGLEATRLLRQWEAASGAAYTPIVIVSASAINREVATCIAAGADAHLAKPFRLQELQAVLHRWLAT